MTDQLPRPTKGAIDVAEVASAVFFAAFAAMVPAAAVAAPLAWFAIKKRIQQSQHILVEELRTRGLAALANERHEEFVPMAYRFIEAAKQGEAERSLKLLAAFIAGELSQEVPDASNFARMARALEGLSLTEMRTIALVDAALDARDETGFASATALAKSQQNVDGMSELTLAQALHELSGRALLTFKIGEDVFTRPILYSPSDSFNELVAKAKDAVHESRRV